MSYVFYTANLYTKSLHEIQKHIFIYNVSVIFASFGYVDAIKQNLSFMNCKEKQMNLYLSVNIIRRDKQIKIALIRIKRGNNGITFSLLSFKENQLNKNHSAMYCKEKKMNKYLFDTIIGRKK